MTASRVCITATLAAALLLDAASLSAAALDRASLTRWSASLVKVEASDPDAHVSIGSGVAVAPERIVTNCHVTRAAEHVFIIHRGLRWRAVAQSPDTEHDLCVLHVPGLAAVSAQLGAARTLRVGEAVWAFGFEGGIRLQVRSGIVRALHAYDDGWVVESTTPFTSGASGGALFDENGRLAAILTYRLRGDRRSYFSVPVEWFLQRVSAEQSYATVMPLHPASPFWERAQGDLPFFLRAHQLELGADWDALLKLTDEWSKVETGNAEPWLLRGRSFTQTHDLTAAQAALEHAIELDPGSSRAWLELGRLSAHRGSVQDARLALAHLNRFSPELARCLAAELPFESQTPADADVENCSSL
jgi:serine protease Do